MKFDLHCHTSNGSLDGKVSIENYIQLLQRHGFDGMLITDHNSYNGYRAYKKLHESTHKYDDFVVLKGVEYDTLDAGHFLVIMPEKVKLPILEIRGMPLSLLLKVVHGFGGILGPAHPYGAKFLSAMHSKKLKRHPELIYDFDFIETDNTCNPHQGNVLARDMAKRYHKPAVAGSDAHKVKYIGTAYTNIDYPIRGNNDFINAVRLKKIADCGCRDEVYTEPKVVTKILPVSLAWKVYNYGLGFLKSYSRKVNLNNLKELWEKFKPDALFDAKAELYRKSRPRHVPK